MENNLCLRLGIIVIAFAAAILLFVTISFAQHEHMTMPMQESQDQSMKLMEMNGMYGQYPMSRESSGTSWQPDSTPRLGLHSQKKNWTFMTMDFLNVAFTHQSGPQEALSKASGVTRHVFHSSHVKYVEVPMEDMA